jgi:hypothetical protein
MSILYTPLRVFRWTSCAGKNYEPVTEPANVIVPQVFAKFVVSGAWAVNVVAVPLVTVNPSGTSSQTVYNVTTEGEAFEFTAPITRMNVLRYAAGPVLAVCVNNVVFAVVNA